MRVIGKGSKERPNMKKIILTAIAGIMLAIPVAALADEPGPSKDPKWVEKHVERLSKKLDLTRDQKVLIRALLDQKRKRMLEVRNELTLIREQTAKEIKSLLTDEQKKKYEKIEMKMKKNREGD